MAALAAAVVVPAEAVAVAEVAAPSAAASGRELPRDEMEQRAIDLERGAAATWHAHGRSEAAARVGGSAR